MTLSADGSYSYTAKPTADGEDVVAERDHFEYTVIDGDGTESTANLDIDIGYAIHGSEYNDTVIFKLLDEADARGGNVHSVWNDFNADEGDKVDISDLLSDWDGNESTLGNYVQVHETDDGNGTVLAINLEGNGDQGTFTDLLTVEGKPDLTLDELLGMHHDEHPQG